jgi:hypothetical protein
MHADVILKIGKMHTFDFSTLVLPTWLPVEEGIEEGIERAKGAILLSTLIAKEMTTAIDVCEIVVNLKTVSQSRPPRIWRFGHFRRKHQHGTAPTAFYCLT